MSCTSTSALVAQPGSGSDRDPVTLYISLELSPSKWLVTSLVSGADKMSKHLVPGGDCAALLTSRSAQGEGRETLRRSRHDRGDPGSGTGRLLAASPTRNQLRRELDRGSLLGRRAAAGPAGQKRRHRRR